MMQTFSFTPAVLLLLQIPSHAPSPSVDLLLQLYTKKEPRADPRAIYHCYLTPHRSLTVLVHVLHRPHIQNKLEDLKLLTGGSMKEVLQAGGTQGSYTPS
ncbi:hypothetical protein ILYODFUR_010667 [Ilyodon furcidens]|uniref:Uncharacterized protein n=1 Tax=Ilyodon furcidens TaxID=33524 RepID=A0ABV0TTL0_9TELE